MTFNACHIYHYSQYNQYLAKYLCCISDLVQAIPVKVSLDAVIVLNTANAINRSLLSVVYIKA